MGPENGSEVPGELRRLTESMEYPFRAELALSSRYHAIEIACVVLAETLKQAAPGTHAGARTELALREVLANAIQHGNGLNSPEAILVELEVRKEDLEIRVSDRGRGFDHKVVPDPSLQENILRSHGRGIFSMRECMDSVAFSPRVGGGTTVTMCRILT